MPSRLQLVPAALLLLACGGGDHRPRAVGADSSPASAPASPGAWLAQADRLDTTDLCARAVRDQLRALGAETLSTRLTFERYPARAVRRSTAAPLDVSSLRSAREFRTKLREALDTAGVNFAAHHAIVEVGMTGWGPNYWIVDRRTGRAYEFPYKATYLDFTVASTLVVMDSKAAILRAMERMADYRESCSSVGASDRRHTDLRPFYFRWEGGGRLEQLAPADAAPPVNAFWRDYFSGR